jgi:ubiquinone/menaquinone biosynthesis C-methylase UbiE
LADQNIRFDDGVAYARYMGGWSQRVGDSFIDWLAPKPGLRWLDVGCGNGAFTESIVGRCAPSAVSGIDPSEKQLAYARSRPELSGVDFREAGAMDIPYPEKSFDISVMPLVIFFVPDPVKGIAEMYRVTSAGGIVCAYSWDMVGGGFPYAVLHKEMEDLGVVPATAPSVDASRIEVTQQLWKNAGLKSVESHVITVERTFADFDDYWATIQCGPSVSGKIKAMTPDTVAELRSRMRSFVDPKKDSAGRITYSARANAIRGIV